MKRRIAMFLCMALLCALAVPASAAGEGPRITLQPQNYQFPEYSVAIYTVKAEGNNLSAYWYMEWEGKTYNLSDRSGGIDPWEGYAGESYGPIQVDANTFTYIFSGIEAGLNGAEIWCVIEDGHYDVTSARAIITVQGDAMPPQILQMPVSLTVAQGGEAELRCIASNDAQSQLMFQWYETTTGKLQDIRALDEETTDYIFCDTAAPGTRYYVCCVTTEEGGRAYSSVVPVTVEAGQQVETEITTDKLPDAVVGQAYSFKIASNDPTATFGISYNPGGKNDFDKTGLTLKENGELTGTPAQAGSFTFTVCATGATADDYKVYTLVVAEAATEPPVTEPDPETQPATEDTEPAVTQPEPTEASREDTADPTEKEPGSKKDRDGEEGGLWLYLGIGLGVLTLAGVVAIVLLLKPKKK